MVEALIGEMFGSDRNRPLDYMRAVVVDKKFAEYESKPLFESGRTSLLKKGLTEPTLLEMSD